MPEFLSPALQARLLPSIVSLLLAAYVTYQDLISEPRYTRTSFLLWKKESWGPTAKYLAVYAVIAMGICLAFPKLLSGGGIKIEGVVVSSVWTQAVMIGVSVKSLMGIKLWTIASSESSNVSIETLIGRLLNFKRMLEEVKDGYFVSLREYATNSVGPVGLADVKTRLIAALNHLERPELGAFQADLDKTSDPYSAVKFFLERFGRKFFEQAFPRP